MIWVALAGVAVMGFIIHEIYVAHKQGEGIGFGLFLGVIAGGLVAIVILGIGAAATGIFAEKTERLSHEVAIVAAVDNTMMNGHFYLFGGQINETPVYEFYRQSHDGAISQGNVPVNKSVIYEDQEDKGFIEVYRSECVDWSFWFYSGCSGYNYKIHVPEDSVTRQFEFDLN